MNRLLSPEFRRLAAWSIGPCLPAWAGLAALALLGRLSWWDAGIASAVIWVLLTVFILRRLRDFDAVILYAEALLQNPEAPAPVLTHSATAVRMAAAMTALQGLWTNRRDEAEATARSRQNIIDALPDPLLLLDRRRRVRNANAAARELFNLQASDLQIGGIHGRLVADRDLASLIRDPKVLDAVDTALAQNRRSETQLSLPSPIQRTYDVLIVPMPDPVEESSAVIVALSDQTERLKVERMRADFVANASHELRTPLAAVLGFIETLRGPAKDDAKARAEFLEIMFKQASRMARLIDDLLSLSRIELREHARPADAVDIVNVLRSTVELLQVEANRRKTRISLDVPADLPAALGDHGELGQVFANLLANAIKYGSDEGRIEISAGVASERPLTMPGSGPCLRISVRDHGEGIAREHIPRLTERFYRVDNARSRSLGGTGLGLAIVKHITNRHRGALTIDSTPGLGSTFTVWLPQAPRAAAP
jgi:two-component system phosphate regulon sensor histidine kinase PhoR